MSGGHVHKLVPGRLFRIPSYVMEDPRDGEDFIVSQTFDHQEVLDAAAVKVVINSYDEFSFIEEMDDMYYLACLACLTNK